MSLIKWEPLSELEGFMEERTLPLWPRSSADLAADIYEEGTNVIANVSLPGVQGGEVRVEIEDNLLSVSGTRSEESNMKTKDYFCKEIRRGSFTRNLQLPRPVDAKAATAIFTDGILTVTMPILPGESTKTVRIPVGA